MKRVRAVVAVVFIALLLSVGAFGANGVVQKYVSYENMQLRFNNRLIPVVGANYAPLEPLRIDGNIYLPVETIQEIAGVSVSYDHTTHTIIMNTDAQRQYGGLYGLYGAFTPGQHPQQSDVYDQTSSVSQQQSAAAQSKYRIGDTWTVPGQWSLTITGVRETEERSESSDKNPAAVYIVEYDYTNLGYTKENQNGIYLSLESGTIVDAGGKVTYSYPADGFAGLDAPRETPVGATCSATAVFGVETPGSFQIIFLYYDAASNRQSATFYIDLSSGGSGSPAPGAAAQAKDEKPIWVPGR